MAVLLIIGRWHPLSLQARGLDRISSMEIRLAFVYKEGYANAKTITEITLALIGVFLLGSSLFIASPSIPVRAVEGSSAGYSCRIFPAVPVALGDGRMKTN